LDNSKGKNIFKPSKKNIFKPTFYIVGAHSLNSYKILNQCNVLILAFYFSIYLLKRIEMIGWSYSMSNMLSILCDMKYEQILAQFDKYQSFL